MACHQPSEIDSCAAKLSGWIFKVYALLGFDETTASAVIKLQEGCIRLYDKKDLFQFGRWDIHHLSLHQINVVEDIFEPAAKEYTSMVVDIVRKGIWNGAMGR